MLFVKRLLAYWLDFVLLASLLVGLQWLLYAASSGFPFDKLEKGYQIELWVLLSMSLPVWCYFIYYERRHGYTPGKRLLKLKVTNNKGRNLSFSQALVRTAAVGADPSFYSGSRTLVERCRAEVSLSDLYPERAYGAVHRDFDDLRGKTRDS
jgi:uncharacterized RDD family membrane protein YckC